MPIESITRNYLYEYIMTTYVLNKGKLDENGDKTKPVIMEAGGSRCFEKNTLVKTDNGEKKISELEKGDKVLSFNHKNNEEEFKNVINVFKNENNKKKCYCFKFKNGDEIKCTEDHEIYLNKAYRPASIVYSMWKNKQASYKTKETNLALFDILSIEEIELSDTYDLTVQDNSNYYLSANGGTLVHNSGKTVTSAQVILTFCEHFSDPKAKNKKDLHIKIYRNTSVDSRKTFNDVIKTFTRMGLKPITSTTNPKTGKVTTTGDYEKVESPRPVIRYKGHIFEFVGMPEGDQQAEGCDISFINEIVENNNPKAFFSIVRRTELLVLVDWNPSRASHYAYNIKRVNYHYPITTYLDNKWLPTGQKADAESQCPWDLTECEYYLERLGMDNKMHKYKLPEDFSLKKWYERYYQSDEAKEKGEYFDGFLRRRWLKPERPEICKEEDYHLYRTPNKLNYENGTVSRADWLTYGEGIPSGQEGAIFKDNVRWVDKFPDSVDHSYFGLDYGFTADKSALVRCGNIGMDMYIEKLCYQKTGTSDLLFDLIEKPLLNEEKRRYIEANDEEWYNKLLALRMNLRKVQSALYPTIDEKQLAVDNAYENLNAHIDNGLPIEPIYVVTDTQDVYKGRGSAEEQQFTIDLNLKARQHGYNWKFIKVGSKPIVPGIALMKKFNLCLIKDKDFETEQQNYCYIKDEAGEPTNIPDKDSKFNHIWDAARYCIWKFFKFIFSN